VPVPDKQLSYMAAYNALKKFCTDAGLDAKKFGLLRSGATTDAFAKNLPEHLIDLRGRWKSAATKHRYCKPSVNDLLSVHCY
jgi:hypothetical protein